MRSGKIILTALFFISSGVAAQIKINYTPSDPLVLLPDGTQFMSWSDNTIYRHTYHVDQKDPKASDNNDGSEEFPFRTINRAAQVVKPGERVSIHSGIYREMIRPLYSGDGPDRMIAYEAVPGEEVIISGSREVPSKWVISIDPNDPENITRSESGKSVISTGNIFSKDIWMTTMPDNMFEYGYFPLRIANTTVEEFRYMDWATRWIGRRPYSLPRCLLFQNGKRMSQLSAYEDLVRLPGSCWVSGDGKTIHIHPFNNINPNSQTFEIGVQEHIIQPQSIGLGFIRITGLVLEHCANGFLRAGTGALFTMGGHHWIIEKNIVRQVNALGIEIGSSAYERRDPRNPGSVEKQGKQPSPGILTGHHIVRGNIIHDCGTAGIRGLGVEYALVENNTIFGCGWQDVEFLYEVAGIKLLINRGTLVQNNHVHDIRGGCGIWLDWDNRNSRVTRNVIHDISTAQGAIFLEASQIPNLIDNNIIWSVTGEGVYLCDTDNTLVVHNLFGNVTENQVVARVKTDRSLGGRKLTSVRNQIVNNIFVNPGKPIIADDPSNTADFNAYITSSAEELIKDQGQHSVLARGDIRVERDQSGLIIQTDSRLPEVPVIRNCEMDFFNSRRTNGLTIPGPFRRMSDTTRLKL